jgi:hypothetical protein
VVTVLVEIWDIFEQPCGQRMVAVLRSELDRLRKLGELRCIRKDSPLILGDGGSMLLREILIKEVKMGKRICPASASF